MGGKSTSTSDPKLNQISIQTSSLGLPMSIGWGRGRLKCNLIWYGAFRAIAHTTKTSGGKGLGGSSKNTTYTYTASVILAICDGPISGIATVYKDKSVYTGSTALKQAGLSVALGTPEQAPWSYMVSKFPSQALAYSGIAYVYAQDYALDDSASLSNHSFEVNFPIQVAGLPDANPRDILVDFLTNPQHGVPGWGAGLIGDLSDWANYCLAYNLLLSPVIEDQTTASDEITEWMTATGSEVVWSEGVLKVGVYGDSPATANGVTWTPNLVPLYDLTEDDFYVASPGDAPVTLAIQDQSDAYNYVQVEWLDRSNQYNVAIMPAQDLDNITTYGPRRQDPTTLHSICDAEVAQTSAQLLLQRTLYMRETYTFKLPWNFAILEPMFDFVTLTTVNDSLQLNRRLVQIVQIDEDADDSSVLQVTAIGVDVGVASAAKYSSHSGDGYAPNQEVDPGAVSHPILINAPNSLTGTDPQVWIAAASTSPLWGGCEVWVSADDTEYTYVGRITGPARMGYTTSQLPLHTDPDNDSSVGVDVSSSIATLTSVTQVNADRGSNLSIVDDEIITFQEATLQSAYLYELSGFRRGLYGSSPAEHDTGAPFAQLDDAIFRFGYGDLNISGHIYIKLPSFNIYGLGLEDISTLPAFDLDLEYNYPTTEWSLVVGTGRPQDYATAGAPNGTYVGSTLAEDIERQIQELMNETGTDLQPPGIPTGLSATSALAADGTVDLTFNWTANTESDLADYVLQVALSGGNFVSFSAPNNSYVFHGLQPNTPFQAQVEAIDHSGNASGFSPVYSDTTLRDTTPPAAPTNLSYSAGLNSVQLDVSAPSDADTVAIRFYSSSGGSFASAAPVGDVNATPGLSVGRLVAQSGGTTLYYWATALDSSGNESVPAGPITARTYSLTDADFTPGLYPTQTVSALPASTGSGRVVFLSSDGKLYRDTTAGWTAQTSGFDITDGTLYGNKIVAGTIQSAQLAAGAVTASKLGVLGESLFPDPLIQDPHFWDGSVPGAFGINAGQNYPGAWYINTDAASNASRAGGTNAWVIDASRASAAGLTGNNIQVLAPAILGITAGTYYEFSVTGVNATNRSSLAGVINWLDSNGGLLQPGAGVFIPNDGVPHTLSLQAQAPAGAVAYRFYADLNGGTDPLTGYACFGNITIRQASGGTAIIDGTLTSAKLVAGTITADYLAAGSITGDKISSATSLPATLSIGLTGYTLQTTAGALAAGQSAGANMVTYSGFPAGTKGYSIGYIPHGQTFFGVGTTAGKNYLAWQFSATATYASDNTQALSILTDPAPCSGNTPYWAGAYFQVDGQLNAYIRFYDNNGNLITSTGGSQLLASYLATQQVFPTSSNGAAWEGCRAGNFVTSPVGATTYRIEVYLLATHTGANTGYMAGPMVSAASPGQSIAPAYVAGPNPDAAAIVNANTTLIAPGKILISGANTLVSWIYGGDNTSINGGAIAANTITANKLTIGNRGLTWLGLSFQVINGATAVQWPNCYVQYTDVNGNLAQVSIAGATQTLSNAVWYFYWTEGSSAILSTTNSAVANAPGAVCLCTWVYGSYLLVQNFGGTIIDGSQISTGSIYANRLVAQSITGYYIAANTITGDNIAANTIEAIHIVAESIDTTKITIGGVDTPNIAGNAVSSITAGNLSSGQVSSGSDYGSDNVAVSCTGGPMVLRAELGVARNAAGTGTLTVYLNRNGSALKSMTYRSTNTSDGSQIGFTYIDNPGAGTFNYTITATIGGGSGGYQITSPLIVAQEFKR